MPLRIVSLNSFLPGFRLVSSWAERHGHQLVLVVTTPIGSERRYDATRDPFVLGLPPGTDILVTGRLRAVAAPVIAALEPDLVISAAYPRLIPPEILDIPRYGALNLHPSALPAGRGPNPFRLVYEGATTIAATLHRTARSFDSGPILSQVSGPLPNPLTRRPCSPHSTGYSVKPSRRARPRRCPANPARRRTTPWQRRPRPGRRRTNSST